MPMDGLTLGFAVREVDARIAGGRVDKITQPERDTVILLIRAGNENLRLLLCASPSNARCHLTGEKFANPLEPPVFCMTLRKQLNGARVQGIRQVGGDRVVYVDFDVITELGDHELRRLVLEVMGRYSNLMLLDGTGRILEAARHVSADMSRVRQILPGLPYEAPPAQDKLAPEEITAEALQQRLRAQGDIPLAKALMASVSGLSMLSARELSFRVLPAGCDRAESEAEAQDMAARLALFLQHLPEKADPRLLVDENGDALDVLPFAYLHLAVDREKACGSLSGAMEAFFGARDRQDRIHQKSAAMVRLLKNEIARCEKKLALQEEELASAARMDEYRVMGEVLNANLWQLQKGMTEVRLPNWYDEAGGTITIPLDRQLTPSQNAQRYFKRYQKTRSARERAAQEKEKTLRELNLLEGMLLDVGKCVGESELEEIREELAAAGYMKRVTDRRRQRVLPPSRPYHYRSADGIDIYVGKNARQNERLTASARGDDLWLHAKDMPGSHVIAACEGDVPEATLRAALTLAAWYSKGQRSSNVPVDYTRRRHVKKPGGTPAGFVIYTHQHTAWMTVSEQDVRAIELVEE